MTILDTNPDVYANLSEEVEEEEQALTLLGSFFDKVWARFDEPSIEDYYNF